MDDERFYQEVADELKAGPPKEGLWLKALSQAKGDEKQAKLIYVELRVKQLKRKALSESASEARSKIGHYLLGAFLCIVASLGLAGIFGVVNLAIEYRIDTLSTVVLLIFAGAVTGAALIALFRLPAEPGENKEDEVALER